MSAATVLTSAMSGVPALSGSGGSLAALFRYIAPILGWSIEFDNGTDIIVIRPQSYRGGQALFYRIDDRAARGGAAPRVAEVRAYESMSDINTGAGLVGPAYIQKSPTADTVSCPYTVAGDAYGCFFNTAGILSGTMRTKDFVSYIGFDIPLTGNVPKCLLMACGIDGQSSGTSILRAALASITGYDGLFVHRSLGGTLNTKVALRGGLFDIGGWAIGSEYSGSNWSSSYKPLPTADGIVAPVYYNDGAAYTIAGRLPAFSRQSKTFTGYTSVSGYDGSGTEAYNNGTLLVSNTELRS